MKEEILKKLALADYSPLKAHDLAARLKITDKTVFLKTITELVDNGSIIELKNGKLCLPKDADLLVGRINFRQSGAALVFPENGGEPIGVSVEETGVALQGDQVVLRLIPAATARRYRMGPRGRAVFDEGTSMGRVIRILKRARTRFTGTLEKSKTYWDVIPDDPRMVRNFIVPDPKTSGLMPLPQEGDKVVVEMEEWKHRHVNPEGSLVQVLGKSHEPLTEHAALFVQYGLQKDFPPEVEAEARRVSVPVSSAQAAGRLDLRQQPVFTIDPDDAKDFDDALHVEYLQNGNVKIGIHIADVSAYVLPGTALDIEAERRGNSTYLVGEVVPMLPHALSSGVCSLKEAEDRLTKSVLVTFNDRAEVVNVEYANTVIRSIKRLTYKQAKMILDENEFDNIRNMPQPPAHQTGFSGRPMRSLNNDEIKLLQTHIRQMWSIAKKLRSARMKAGSLDLDMPEAKIYVDERGYPCRIDRIEHDESHQLVEEFMLLANECVARAFNRGGLPAVHRVHPKPEAEKLNELREQLALNGVKVGDLNNQQEVARFLALTRSHPKGVYLKGLFLRSMKQACYKASPDGHFGLAKSDYTHFTSPIRRYADFVVHRIFDAYLKRNNLPTAPAEVLVSYNVARLQGIADHISITEQNSTEAERQSVKNRLLEYFEIESKRPQKRAFDATISDVKNHGFFVELSESMAYGLVHVSTMENDFYILSADEQSLFGRQTKVRYCIGDKIRVTVAKVDRFKRQIDFALAAAPAKAEDAGAEKIFAYRPARNDVRARTPQAKGETRGGRTAPRRGSFPGARNKNIRGAKPARGAFGGRDSRPAAAGAPSGKPAAPRPGRRRFGKRPSHAAPPIKMQGKSARGGFKKRR